MAESGESYVVELQAGVGDPPFVPLYVDAVLNPMSIGRRGMWRVEASGVLDVHAYMYFDGRSLFLQSADEERPVLAHGRAVGRAWTSVNAPCTITLGNARLEFRATYDDDGEHVEDIETARTRQPPVGRASRPFEPGAFTRRTDDEEATRMHPVESASRVGMPRPAAGLPSAPPPANMRGLQQTPIQSRHLPPGHPMSDGPPRFPRGFVPRSPQLEDLYNAPSMGPPPMRNMGPPPMLNIPPPGPTAPTVPTQQVGAWDKLSGPKRILLLMSPFLLMAIYLLFRDEPQPQAIPRPRPSASVPDSAPSNPYAQTTGTRPPQVIPSIAVTPTQTLTSSPAFSATALPSASRAPPDRVQPPPVASSPVTKTLERTAVDLVASGQYEKAAQMYDQLAVANPSNAVYREAARILRKKLDGGG